MRQASPRGAETIDGYLFAAMDEAGVKPAGPADDFEFIRRVTLDLTGRIPTPERVLAFAADTSPDKRPKLIDELLSSPEWVDKWTMFFGDLLKNNDSNSQVTRFPQGRNAFYRWIRDSLAAEKPYDQMAREIISARGGGNWDPANGAVNWMFCARPDNAIRQDVFDRQAGNVAATFLGISDMVCLLCHDGRGHLDSLNLWASRFSRFQAWQFAAFLSHSRTRTVQADTQYQWAIDDNATRPDYALDTVDGHAPPRRPLGGVTNVSPVYPFSGRGPAPGEDYREAMAREVTSDVQFARATVNYLWKEFFSRGLVEPVDGFDPARLDPDNPPPSPWTLQPSHPRLLNALAQAFIDGGFSLKSLMRMMVNARAYQLSSRWNGDWNPAWDPLFARKLVRRLWAEELHDAIAQSSGVAPAYWIDLSSSLEPEPVQVHWAMQLPQTTGLPGGEAALFLDSLQRGDRDQQARRSEGSITVSLALQNHPFVTSRLGKGIPACTRQAGAAVCTDDQLIDTLFLAVLSRFPEDAEKRTALAMLQQGDRTQAVENLQWSLYNKIDFILNH